MFRIFTIFAAISLILSTPVFADELFFKNGDHLSGKFVGFQDGKITFESANTGSITIDVSKVETVSTDERMEIHLKSGDVIFVAMDAVSGGFFAPESPEARIYSASDITSINRIDEYGPPLPSDSQTDIDLPKRKTSGKVTVDASLKPGTIEDVSTGVNLDISRKTGDGLLSANVGYSYSEQIDKVLRMKSPTQDSIYAIGKYDFSLRKKPFGYISTKFESDRVSDLDSRITTDTSLQYEVIQRPNLSFNVQSGAELQYEKYGQNDERDMSANLGWSLKKKFSKKLMFSHGFKYSTESRDFSDLFLSTDAELRSNLTKSLFYNFRMALDYDSTSDSTDPINIKYTLGIGWDLF